jgi:N-acetyl-alpha-D-muramate 1-phosphate uridylyltransferase
MLPVAILAGGLATRLGPLTHRVPKALVPVAGRPFLFHVLEWLREQNASRVILCVGHLGEEIRRAVGDGRAFGLSVEYSSDGGTLRGTGGALKHALTLLGPDFFVLYGDAYLPCSLERIRAAYLSARRPALMTVLRNENRWDQSNVWLADGEILEYDKRCPRTEMRHIDFGVSVLSAAAFEAYRSRVVLDLAEVWRDLSLAGRLAALEVAERFYEIGTLQGLRETEAYLTARRTAATLA